MTPEKLNELILQGEGIEVEFKTSRFELSKDTFETICAFLNRKGGHLLLGVKDNGNVEGIMESSIQNIINNIITNANNPQKLNPPFYLSTHVIDCKDKKVIYLYIPESSQVHNTSGKIFDRNDDGDFDITKHHDQVTQLYLRKQSTYSENKVFPYVEMADFNSGLFKRVRTIAENLYAQHPWMEMKDEDLLRYSGFYKKDPVTGKAGYTLAGILLLGNDETIIDALPHHKTDAILRVENIDRYDDRVYAENWNRPHGSGAIDPANFSPYPKNPVIARFFKEIGRVDELGSGVRNTFRYCGIYSPGTEPEFIEGDIFKTIIPLKAEKTISPKASDSLFEAVNDAVGDAVSDAVSDAVKERLKLEMIFIITNNGISLDELKKQFDIERATAQRDMKLLKNIGWVDFAGPPKTGKYKMTEKGSQKFDYLGSVN